LMLTGASIDVVADADIERSAGTCHYVDEENVDARH
jgi:hypothetical protein